MDLGVAGTLAVEQISGEWIQREVNQWLEQNSDLEVIDIKFAASTNQGNWNNDALIIYRKEV